MKKIIIIGVLCILCVFLTFYYLSNKEFIVRITEKQIQNMLNERFPFKKDYFIIINVDLNNPRVNLTDGKNRVYAGLDINLGLNITGKLEPLGGSLDISGGVKYNSEKGSFYLTDPIIENLSVRGIPRIYMKKVNSALTEALIKIYEYRPIYTLKASDTKQAVAKLVLKDVSIENKELLITLGL